MDLAADALLSFSLSPPFSKSLRLEMTHPDKVLLHVYTPRRRSVPIATANNALKWPVVILKDALRLPASSIFGSSVSTYVG